MLVYGLMIVERREELLDGGADQARDLPDDLALRLDGRAHRAELGAQGFAGVLLWSAHLQNDGPHGRGVAHERIPAAPMPDARLRGTGRAAHLHRATHYTPRRTLCTSFAMTQKHTPRWSFT